MHSTPASASKAGCNASISKHDWLLGTSLVSPASCGRLWQPLSYLRKLLHSKRTALSRAKQLQSMSQLTSVAAAWCKQTMAVSEGASSPGAAMQPSPTYWSCGLGCHRVSPRPAHTLVYPVGYDTSPLLTATASTYKQ